MFEHRAIVPPGAGDPPFCTCGVVGGNGITRPLLADHLRVVAPPTLEATDLPRLAALAEVAWNVVRAAEHVATAVSLLVLVAAAERLGASTIELQYADQGEDSYWLEAFDGQPLAGDHPHSDPLQRAAGCLYSYNLEPLCKVDGIGQVSRGGDVVLQVADTRRWAEAQLAPKPSAGA